MSGLFPKSKEPAPPSPLEQTAAEVESGAYSGKQDMTEKLETILKTAKTSSEIRQMIKDFLKEGNTPEEVYMSSLIINLIDSLSKTRTEKELLEDIRSVLRTTQTEVRKVFPKGGRRRRSTRRRKRRT